MSERNYKVFKYGGALLFFFLLFWISYNTVFTTEVIGAPDEVMRYDIPLFIYRHGYLPRGDEAELINNGWGLSYGFTPYLASMFSALFMKITSFFTSQERALIVAARFVSVLSGVGTWFFCTKVGEEITKKKEWIVLFTCLVCLLPQFVYLCTYLNNDAFSVFCSIWILYGWIKGLKYNWRVKDCILLGVGIGFMSLAYYYAYAFILCSMILFFWDTIQKRMNASEIIKKALIVFFVAFALGGWYFIRNYIIYGGDFLGLSYEEKIAEIHAVDFLKPSLRLTPQKMGLSVFQMIVTEEIVGMAWIVSSVKSFIGVFGGLSIYLPNIVYIVYIAIILLGMGGWIFHKEGNKLLTLNLFMCIVIPVCISVYYSYSSDYQPQGRYFISALCPLMFLVAIGIDHIFKNKKWVTVICLGYSILLVSIVYFYIRLNCFL